MANYDASIRVNTKVDNSDLRAVQREVDALTRKLDAVRARSAKLEILGGTEKQFESLGYDAEILEDNLAAASARLEELKKVSAISDGFEKTEKSSKKCFKSIWEGTKKSNGLLATFGTRLKGIALSLLVFNWITKGFNAMVQTMKEGYQNLAHYSDEYNESMSALKSESAKLKNGLAAAFEPLVNTIVPYLTQLVAWLNTAADAAGQFFAAMQGKSTYTRAKKQVVDYAKSLDSATKSAKGALAAFDNLNVLNKNSDSSGIVSAGGEVGGRDAFEDAQVNDDILNVAQKCKEVLELLTPYAEGFAEGFLGFFEELGEVVTPTVAEVLKDIVATLSSGDPENAKSWGEAFAKILTAFAVLKGATGIITFLGKIGAGGKKVVSFFSKAGLVARNISSFGTALLGIFSMNPDALAMSMYQLGELLEGTCFDPDTWDGWLGDAHKSIKKGWNDFWDKLFADAEKDVKEGLAETFNWDRTNEVFNIAGDWFAEMAEDFEEQDWLGIGEDLVNGIGYGIKGVIMTVLEPIKDHVDSLIEDLINDIDGLVEYFNDEVRKIQQLKNGLTLGAGVGAAAIGKGSVLDGIKLPGLANGMVIQGGKPFAAILGDQPAGQTNIETPLSTMVQAFRQVMSENRSAGGGNYTFVAQLNGRTLFRETVRQDQMQFDATGRGAFQH